MENFTQESLAKMTPDDRAQAVYKEVAANSGKAIEGGFANDRTKVKVDTLKEGLLANLSSDLKMLNALRKGDAKQQPEDVSLASFMNDRYGFAINTNGGWEAIEFMKALGMDTTNSLNSFSMSTPNLDGDTNRWLVKEVIREAIRTGLREQPYYNSLIAGEESVGQRQVTMPQINMSAALPTKVNEFETITKGKMSFGQKVIEISKHAIGIEFSDEVLRAVSIDMLRVWLSDVGVKFGAGLDSLAVQTLILGDGVSPAADTVGVTTANTLTYADILRVWVRLGRLGRMANMIVADEALTLTTMGLAEFKTPRTSYAQGTNPSGLQAPSLKFRNPVPETVGFATHGSVGNANYLLMVDSSKAMMKFNNTPLLVEEMRNAANQATSYFVSQTTGFGCMFDDARVVIDVSAAYASNGFSSIFDVSGEQAANVLV